MTMTEGVGARAIDARKGTSYSGVSRQWLIRGEDEKFRTLEELRESVGTRRSLSHEATVLFKDVRFESRDGDDAVMMRVDGAEYAPTNWSFGQLCQNLRLVGTDGTVGVPAAWLRCLPPRIAALNMQVAASMAGGSAKLLLTRGEDGQGQLRAVTSPTYGRIWDAECVDQVIKIAAQGDWKVPGVIDWASGSYDPDVPVTKETTTLFGSDRDVFMFQVDDKHPIEVGKLKNGDPDLIFRGFIVSNSETGNGKFELRTMYLRGVCCNRMLWGVERMTSFSIRHNSGAPDRFAGEVMPHLEVFAHMDPDLLVHGVRGAKELILAKGEEKQMAALADLGFARGEALGVLDAGRTLEGHDPESVWDFAQAITAFAQGARHSDERFRMELVAGQLLDRVPLN